MEKLRAEMSQLDRKTDALSRADLRKMRYLQNVIKESKFGTCLLAKDITDVWSPPPVSLRSRE
jgi:hypothetical protein